MYNDIEKLIEDYTKLAETATITNPDFQINGTTLVKCINQKPVMTIPKNVEIIGSWAFKECSSIQEIVLPNTITSINTGAFSGCENLTKINLPNSITEIGAAAFQNCTNLIKIYIPSNVTEIRRQTFKGCLELKIVKLPDGLHMINPLAFEHCKKLQTIKLPKTITNIDTHVFLNSGLKIIEIPVEASIPANQRNPDWLGVSFSTKIVQSDIDFFKYIISVLN